MKVTLDFEIKNCKDCPFLTTGRTYGNDGRDGYLVYMCKKGVFGGAGDFGYDMGEDSIPKVPPYGCPYIKTNALDRIASKLGIITEELKDVLDQEHCDIVEI